MLAILDEYVEEIKNLESTLKYIDSKIQEFDYEIGSLSLGFLKQRDIIVLFKITYV
ncbi:hypothetical protein [Candidatus Rickettsia colombianensi]|uniref:hypothetical protein n=1 Tax=Candidatus Rickettsia colombianensi TaxID=1090944 RepID=UPI0015B340F8|nr:hypothetical protein [Candidatus Rickettsia colombianensi]